MTRFLCVQCRTPLPDALGALTCPGCQAQVPVVDGIPSFVGASDYYYGEVSRELMQAVVADAQTRGWSAAFQRLITEVEGPLAAYIEQYITDESRSAWKYLLNLPADGTALDFGCGWGVTSLSLARNMRHVISMDLTRERLLLLRERARECAVGNVEVVHAGDRLPLPLADESVDVIVVNGVLEWFPVSYPGPPRAAQQALLAEFRRILKPAGQLYIGIENRLGYKYFLGAPDEHSKLRFTTLLPRWLADRWSRWRTGKAYRTYTYSKNGYRRLLADAGLHATKFVCPYPDYREFRVLADTQSPAAVRGLFQPKSPVKRALLHAFSRTGLLTHILPTFGVISAKAERGPSFVERLTAQLGRDLATPLDPPARLQVTRSNVVLGFCPRAGQPGTGVVFRLPLTKMAARRLNQAAANLEAVHQSQPGGAADWLAAVPRLLQRGAFEGQPFAAEEWKHGCSGDALARGLGEHAALYEAAAAWLTAFQRDSLTPDWWNRAALTELAARSIHETHQRVAPLRRFLDQHPDLAGWIGAAADPAPLPAAATHGDLHIGNVLFAEDSGRITGVVDWDLHEAHGFPLTDLLYLLTRRRLERRGATFAECIRHLAGESGLDVMERTLLARYEEAFALPPRARPAALLLMVFAQLRQNAEYRPQTLAGMCAGLADVLEGMARARRPAAQITSAKLSSTLRK